MTFKEQIAVDCVNVFINKEEFSEIHQINGVEMPCQIDNNELIEREKRYQNTKGMHSDGLFIKQLLIYVKAEDFGKLPAIGRVVTVDGKSYIVTDAIDEVGIYSIALEANKT